MKTNKNNLLVKTVALVVVSLVLSGSTAFAKGGHFGGHGGGLRNGGNRLSNRSGMGKTHQANHKMSGNKMNRHNRFNRLADGLGLATGFGGYAYGDGGYGYDGGFGGYTYSAPVVLAPLERANVE